MTEAKTGPCSGKFFYAVILPEGKPLPALVGLDEKIIHPIPYQDITAVVSDYPVTTIKPLRKNLFPYHQVTRTLAESCTTIPARFGQIAQHGEEVFNILRRHYLESDRNSKDSTTRWRWEYRCSGKWITSLSI